MPGVRRDADFVAASFDKPVGPESREARKRTEYAGRIDIVAAGDCGDIDGEIAHHTLDQIRAQAIIGRQDIAFDGR